MADTPFIVPVDWESRIAEIPTPEEVHSPPPIRSGWLSRRWVVLGIAAILPIALLVSWQLTTTLGIVTPSQLRSPGEVWTAAVQLFERGQLVKFIAISTQRVLIGF